jgi:hypothetical protein
MRCAKNLMTIPPSSLAMIMLLRSGDESETCAEDDLPTEDAAIFV